MALLCFIFLICTLAKLQTRGYDISINPVLMRDQLLNFQRTPLDTILGIISNLSFSMVLLSIMIVVKFRNKVSPIGLILLFISTSVYLWASASRLSMLFIIIFMVVAANQKKIKLEELVFISAFIVISGFIFILRAERSNISLFELYYMAIHWLQLDGEIKNSPTQSGLEIVYRLATVYVSHSFWILKSIVLDAQNNTTESLGGIISLLKQIFIGTSTIKSKYAGLMHTEVGFFLNEFGAIAIPIVLLFKCFLASLRSKNIGIYYLKLTIPMGALLSPLSSIFNFAFILPYCVAIFIFILAGYTKDRKERGLRR